MIEAAVKSPDFPGPIRVRAKPTDRNQALINLYAFSNEGRRDQLLRDISGCIEVSTMPRTRRCFGWLKISGREVGGDKYSRPMVMVEKLRREIDLDQEYTAIVYEFIPKGENNPDTVQSTIDFFWRAGFDCFQTTRWRTGRVECC